MATIPPFDAVKRDFDSDGFAVLRGYLDDSEVADLRERAAATARAKFASQPNRGKPQQFANVLKNLQNDDEWFARQLSRGQHVPLIEALVGDELVPATAAWFDRPGGSDERINPHIDGGGRGRGPGVGAIIWIALDAATPDNGCLYYGRGSHRVEYSKGVFNDFDTSSSTAVAVEVAPGDAVVHDALTVHWSGVNHSGRPRRAVSFFYWGAKSHAGLMQNPEWRARMEKIKAATAQA